MTYYNLVIFGAFHCGLYLVLLVFRCLCLVFRCLCSSNPVAKLLKHCHILILFTLYYCLHKLLSANLDRIPSLRVSIRFKKTFAQSSKKFSNDLSCIIRIEIWVESEDIRKPISVVRIISLSVLYKIGTILCYNQLYYIMRVYEVLLVVHCLDQFFAVLYTLSE